MLIPVTHWSWEHLKEKCIPPSRGKAVPSQLGPVPSTSSWLPGPRVQHPRPQSPTSAHLRLWPPSQLAAHVQAARFVGSAAGGGGCRGSLSGVAPSLHHRPEAPTHTPPPAHRHASGHVPRRHHTTAAFLTVSGRSQVHKPKKVTLPTFIHHNDHTAIFTQTSVHLISLLRNHQPPTPTPHSLQGPAGPPWCRWGPSHTCPPGDGRLLSPGTHQTLPPP